MFQDNAEWGRRSMMGIGDGERLVIWGIRKIVDQQFVEPDLPAEFQACFGADGAEGLRIFCSFFRVFGQATRRPYQVAPPRSLLLLRDEQRILILLAAAQLGLASGDLALLEAHLLWIAGPDHRPALCRMSLAFAQLLVAHGHAFAALHAGAPVVEWEKGPDSKDSAADLAVTLRPRLAWGR
jgi:hypothetical protein